MRPYVIGLLGAVLVMAGMAPAPVGARAASTDVLASLDLTPSWLQVDSFKLSNGIPVVASHRDHTDGVLIRLVVNVGLWDFPCEQQQAPHIVEHMLFQGTPKTSESALRQTVKDMGGEFRGYTRHRETYLDIEFHRTYLEQAVSLFHEMVSNSRMSIADFEKSKRIIYAERNIPKPGSFRFDQKEVTVFDLNVARLYPEDSPLGCRHKAYPDAVTHDQAMDLYQDYYRADNMTLIVVGPVRTETLKPMLELTFAGLPQGGKHQSSVDSPPQTEPELLVRTGNLFDSKSHIFVSIPVNGRRHESAEALDLISEYWSETLYRRVRIERALGYTPRARYYQGQDHGRIVAQTRTTGDMVDAALAEFRSLYQELNQSGIPADELRRLQQQHILDALTKEWQHEQLATLYMDHRDWIEQHGAMRPILKIMSQVTPADISAVLNEHFPDQPAVAVSRPKSMIFLVVYLAGVLAVAVVLRWLARRAKRIR